MMSCPGSPRSVATIASPQASFSNAGLYMPWRAGKPPPTTDVEVLLPELAAMLKRQRDAMTETGSIIPTVFHRRGKPIRDISRAWRLACRAAGVPGHVPHDFRRTASRKLRALGMSDRDVAELCGWKTVAMVERYLGRDPAGVADRLHRKVADAAKTPTLPLRSGAATENR